MNQQIPHSDPAKVMANGIEIVYDTFGEPSAPPLLLVMGLGGQMIAWDDGLCVGLAALGYWVIRFDNRDVGLSTKFDEAGVPDVAAMMQVYMQGQHVEAPYSLRDMANDAVGLLDALGIESAHVVGYSMGGMIVQEMAIHHADRIRTMTSIMSNTGNPELPQPQPEAMAVLMKPAPTSRSEYLEQELNAHQVLGGELTLDEDHIRERSGKLYDRGLSPTGTPRHMAAVFASGNRKEALKSVTVPTLVIHGAADPLVPVEGGIDTAETIPGAELLIIDGMGHTLSPVIWPQLIEAIANHAK